jgi:hypothetical protein
MKPVRTTIQKATHGHSWHSTGAIFPCVPRWPSGTWRTWGSWRPCLSLVTLERRREWTNNDHERWIPKSFFQHFKFPLANLHLHCKRNQSDQTQETCWQFTCQQGADKYSHWPSWVDAFKIKAAQKPASQLLERVPCCHYIQSCYKTLE